MKLQQLEISLKLNNLNSVTLGYPKAKHVEFPTDSVLTSIFLYENKHTRKEYEINRIIKEDKEDKKRKRLK